MIVAQALRLGLTGGIGSGKSTVAGILASMGALVVDADAISRATTAPNGDAIEALEAAFGPELITPARALDRERMRALAFSDPAAKARLESIVHPLVRQAIGQQTQEAELAGAHCIVFDIPLLVESQHWRKTLQRILIVDCKEETQIARVTARSGMDAASVKKIMEAQANRTFRLKAADWVLSNEGILLETLEREVRQLGLLFGL